jgi:hypothetical protein
MIKGRYEMGRNTFCEDNVFWERGSELEAFGGFLPRVVVN